ncbi:hypothetical protein RUND412_005110 [Rhizina undulata]
MPPKKEKKEQVTGDQASELIVEYLRQQNRPYSAIDISANLHNVVTKATAAKILKELHEKGEIEGRTSGKQTVYHAVQNPKDSASPEELKAMGEIIEATKADNATLKSELKELQATLNSLKATPTVISLQESVALLQTEIQEIESELFPLRSGSIKPVSMEDKATVDTEYVRLERLIRVRMKQFKDFWGTICDSNDVNPAELWERLGLEEL